jgi:hypothetical protein
VLAFGPGLAGCAYEYEEDSLSGSPASASASAFADAAIPRDPGLSLPVSGAELDAWVRQVLPDAEGQVFHTGYGSLGADEERNETTTQLPEGSYSLTLACRSSKRVSFSIGNDDNDLVDLTLRCGTSRVSVIHLSADTVLTIKVDSDAPSNFAYRVSRI